MSALWWLAIPVAATSIAIAYVIWASRDRGPAPAHRTMARFEKFRRAMDGRSRD